VVDSYKAPVSDPAPLQAALESICSRLDLDASARQIDSLLAFLALLQRWNTHYNLTAVRDPAQMLTQHLADCLAIVGPLQRCTGASARLRLLDVGSGGGLPGAVLAIMLPGVEVTCIDSVGKKAAFIRHAAGELRLPNLHTVHGRAEELRAMAFDVLCSRAFASLAGFVGQTRHLVGGTGWWLAMKGKPPVQEIADLPPDVTVFHVEPLTVPDLAAERCIVWLRRSAEPVV
jgi:16S rRNA (guanine527-N7)-methyltransferase